MMAIGTQWCSAQLCYLQLITFYTIDHAALFTHVCSLACVTRAAMQLHRTTLPPDWCVYDAYRLK